MFKKILVFGLILSLTGVHNMSFADEALTPQEELQLKKDIASYFQAEFSKLKESNPEKYKAIEELAISLGDKYDGMSRDDLKEEVIRLAVLIFDPSSRLKQRDEFEQHKVIAEYLLAKTVAKQYEGLNKEIYKNLFGRQGVLYEKGIEVAEFDYVRDLKEFAIGLGLVAVGVLLIVANRKILIQKCKINPKIFDESILDWVGWLAILCGGLKMIGNIIDLATGSEEFVQGKDSSE